MCAASVFGEESLPRRFIRGEIRSAEQRVRLAAGVLCDERHGTSAASIRIRPHSEVHLTEPLVEYVQASGIRIMLTRVGVGSCIPVICAKQTITQHSGVAQREGESLALDGIARCGRVAHQHHPVTVGVIDPGLRAVERRQWAYLSRIVEIRGVRSRLRAALSEPCDYIDAEAIAEAVGRARMRFVPIKTDDQLDLQSLHRVRERWVSGRTAVINQIRGLLLERGITIRKGRRHIEESLPGILEDADNKLSGALRVLLTQLRLEMQYRQRQVEECDKLILRIADELEDCRRMVAVPGIGPMIATATIAAIGNGSAFKKGRGFAAWLGVVPGEHSTGGKQTLTDTSRRGNRYLRKLFVQGAHAVLQQRMKQSNGLNTWLAQLTSRKRIQVAAVALANKMARMVWAVLSKGEAYRPPLLIETAAV